MDIIGGLEDQTNLIIWGKISNSLFSISDSAIANYPLYRRIFNPLIHPLSDHQPILSAFTSVFFTIFGASSMNLFILLTLVLNLAGSYLLFKRFKYGVIYSLIFVFSSYAWIHFGIHITLSQIWILPVFLHLYLRYRDNLTYNNSIRLGLYISFSALISNYYGFFILLLLAIYFVINSIIQKSANNLKYFATTSFVSIVLIGIPLSPYLKVNYSEPTPTIRGTKTLNAKRPYEDFFTFSSRPWYFFIPHVKNPIFGEISTEVLRKIESTNYFLADDYFPNEHSGNYFGLLFISTVLIVWVYILVRGDVHVKKKMPLYTGAVLVLVLLMFPPFFTISGIKVYTPGYIVFKLFPMFRATTRMGAVVLINMLVILGFGINNLYSKFPDKRRILSMFMSILLVVTMLETFVPFRVVRAKRPPQVYRYLGDNLPSGTKFMVYPYSKSQDALFWVDVHKQHLVNPRGVNHSGIDFAELTKELNTIEGLEKSKEFADYLIVFKDFETLDREFFLGNLQLVKEYNDSLLMRHL